MKGKLITIKTSGEIVSTEITKTPTLEDYQQIVGGYIEAVPGFETYDDEPCAAFCNDEGKLKRLPLNQKATRAWVSALGFNPGDVLVGDVAIVTGDAELLAGV